MTTHTALVVSTTPRRSVLDRETAMRLAATEYDRYLAMLRRLPSEAWSLPTCNTDWDVIGMVRHTVGMTHLSASMVEQLTQLRLANKRRGPQIDALTAVQVERNAQLGAPGAGGAVASGSSGTRSSSAGSCRVAARDRGCCPYASPSRLQ